MRTAFVTGATGLLGSNLVRALTAQGWSVRALARSDAKARRQFEGLGNVRVVQGDLNDAPALLSALEGADVLFHTAAAFRDSYKGGSHRAELIRTNVDGTRALLETAKTAGVRRFVHTSSIAVLNGPPGALIDESMSRDERDADDYYLSKILSERAVSAFLAENPEMWGCMVLPGWMWGPGDLGPTSSGQLAQDFLARRLPGVPPGGFSVVDARDVAEAMIAAERRGRRGERYLAAGRAMTMKALLPALERVSGVPAPTRSIPLSAMRVMALGGEAYARLTGRPVLVSMASVRLIAREGERNRYSADKLTRELGVGFRPVEETLADTVAWLRSGQDARLAA